MIEVEELRKQYGEAVAVDGVSFTARSGEIFGLLGPNGAGKSTTIGCICGRLAPTAGHIRVGGHDVASDGPAARAQLGFVPQEIALYEDLTARENLAYWGGAAGLSRAEVRRRAPGVLSACGLSERAEMRVEAMSGGMKRRLNFACGVLHEPRVLLLDEPTAGVDPQSRTKLLELVREQARRGTCVLYTTHYMEEAESLCDRLVIVDHGRVVASGTLDELRAGVGERDLLRLSGHFGPDARAALERLPEAELLQCEDEWLVLAVADAATALADVFSALSAVDAQVRETTLTRPSLETLFIKLTGGELG